MFKKRIKNNTDKLEFIVANQLILPGQEKDFNEQDLEYLNPELFKKGMLVYVDTVETPIEEALRKDSVEEKDLADSSVTMDKLSQQIKDILNEETENDFMEVIDKIQPIDNQTEFELSKMPVPNFLVTLTINSLSYYEGREFTIDRENKKLTWTFTNSNDGFDILATDEIRIIYYVKK